jgi:hypothetical protein
LRPEAEHLMPCRRSVAFEQKPSGYTHQDALRVLISPQVFPGWSERMTGGPREGANLFSGNASASNATIASLSNVFAAQDRTSHPSSAIASFIVFICASHWRIARQYVRLSAIASRHLGFCRLDSDLDNPT